MSGLQQPTIREATLADVHAIRQFHARSWLDTYPNDEAGVSEAWIRERWRGWDSPEKLEESAAYIRAALADPDQLYRIATVDGQVVALLHASRHVAGQKLNALYVGREQQGTGLSQTLISLADAFWDPGQSVELEVVDYNARAKRFYGRHGFKKIEGSDYMHDDKIPSIRMRREATT